MRASLLFTGVAVVFLAGCATVPPPQEKTETPVLQDITGQEAYQSVMPEQFSQMLKSKDFLLVDVHVPEQEHIEGTDMFIPYDEVEKRISEFPADKDAKIVVYCRSGGMSRVVAYMLLENGYTNVIDVIGGKNAYDALQKSQEISGETQAEHIEVKATVVSETNIGKINQDIGNVLSQDVLSGNSTTVLLVLSNHRDNLAEYNYESMVSIDGMNAKEWLLISSEMGGHHITGILTFAKQEAPQELTVSGLPVDDFTVKLSYRAT